MSLAAAACVGDGAGIADGGDAPELTVVLRGPAGNLIQAVEDVPAPLLTPASGGKVLLAAPRARGIDAEVVVVTALLVDDAGRLIARDRRALRMALAGDGFALPADAPEPAGFANLRACPAVAAEHPVEGVPHLLVLRLEAPAELVIETALHVVPVCAEPEHAAACQLECAPPALGD